MNDSAKTGCPELDAYSRPGMYRTNAFRVLGLKVRDTPQDARRQRQRLEMQRKLGVASTAAELPYALPEAVDDDASRTALDRIGDPNARIFDEFFWFWPLGDGGTVSAAEPLSAWRAAAEAGDAGALHNVALAEHLRLLETEDSALKDDPEQWAVAFAAWQAVINDDRVWDLLRERITELDDASLTSGLARRMREALPGALLSINAAFAREMAAADDLARVAAQVQIIRSAPFDDLATAALRDAVEPVRRRLMAAIGHARSRYESDPLEGRAAAEELQKVAVAQLAVVDAMLPEGDITRAGLHDLIGEAILDAAISFVNKTEDWSAGLSLVERAREVAAGASLLGKLDGHVATLNENLADAHDWCGAGYWEQDQDTLEQAEAIRGNVRAGDHESALRELVALGAGTPGSPLNRSLGYALNGAAIRLQNEALALHNGVSEVLRRLLDGLADLSEATLIARLSDRPDPSGFRTPPCLSCGSTAYTTWVKFTHKDVPLFMCQNCSSEDDAYHKRNIANVKGLVRRAMARAHLAQELEPDHEGLKENVARLDEQAKVLEIRQVSTKHLRKELGLSASKTKPKSKPGRTRTKLAADSATTTVASDDPLLVDDGWTFALGACLLAASAALIGAWVGLPSAFGTDWAEGRALLTGVGAVLLFASVFMLRGLIRVVSVLCLTARIATLWWSIHLPLEPYSGTVIWVIPVAAMLYAVSGRLFAQAVHLGAWLAVLSLVAFLVAHASQSVLPGLAAASLIDVSLSTLAVYLDSSDLIAAVAWGGMALSALIVAFASMNPHLPEAAVQWGARLVAGSFALHIFTGWFAAEGYIDWQLDPLMPVHLLALAALLMSLGLALMLRGTSVAQALAVVTVATHIGIWWFAPQFAGAGWILMGAWTLSIAFTTIRLAVVHHESGHSAAAIQALAVLVVFLLLNGGAFFGLLPLAIFTHMSGLHMGIWCWLVVLLFLVPATAQHSQRPVVVGA